MSPERSYLGPYKTTTVTGIGISEKQNNNFARASRFFVNFFAMPAQLRREMVKF